MRLCTSASSSPGFKRPHSTELFTAYVNQEWVEPECFEKQMLRLPFPPSLLWQIYFTARWSCATVLVGLNFSPVQLSSVIPSRAVCLSFLSCEHHPVNFEQALPHLEIKRQQLTTASFTRALSSKLFVQSLPSFFLLHVYIPHVPTSSASLHDPRFVTIPRLHKYLRAHLFLQAFSLPDTGSAGAVVQAVLHTPACLPAWSPQHHKLLNQSCASSGKHRRTEP